MTKGKGENSIKMVEERERERLKKRRNGKIMKDICTYKHKHESQMYEVSSSTTTKMTSLSINEIIPNEK